MAPFFDDEKKVDTRVGFMTKLPVKVHPSFLKSLDLKTRNVIRSISLIDHEIVDSFKVEIHGVTFFDEDMFLTAHKEKDEECFLRVKQYDPEQVGYILNTFDIKELRVMRTKNLYSMAEVHRSIDNNSAYVENFWCEEFDRTASLLLQKCIAGQLKNVTLNMPHPAISIDPLFYVPGVTCARKFHVIHHKDAPVLFFDFIRRWVQHADLLESVGRKIITEGHSLKSIETFIERVKRKCKRDMINVVGMSNAGILVPKDPRFLILIFVKTLEENNRRMTAVVIPRNTKVENYYNYIRISEDDVQEVEKEEEKEEGKEPEKEQEKEAEQEEGTEKEAEQKEEKKMEAEQDEHIEQNENSTGGIAIEKKDESIGFEKDCSFIDSAELPSELR